MLCPRALRASIGSKITVAELHTKIVDNLAADP
jgi:hypothetical protein